MQPIYIEIADEVTTVIERIRAAQDPEIALVIPKGAILLQSVVNLKLARKAARETNHSITLVTADKIGRNLAAQVGFAVRSKLEGAEDSSTEETPVDSGVKVHRYYEEQNDTVEPIPSTSVAPIIPRTLVQDEQPTTQITKRELAIDTSAVIKKTQQVVEIIAPKISTAALPISAYLPSDNVASPTPNQAPRVKKARHFHPIVFTLYLLLLAVLVTAGIAAIYWPRITVTATQHPVATTEHLQVTARLGAALDSKILVVPSELLTATATASAPFTSSGSKEVGDTAKGTVELRNNLDSNPQVLAAGAKLTAGGRTFTTTITITVPGFKRVNGQDQPGVATATIQADSSGDTGNVTADAVAITSPQTLLSADTLRTSGGTSKQVPVVNQIDVTNAQTALIAKLKAQAQTDLQKQADAADIQADPQADTIQSDKILSTVLANTQAAGGEVSATVVVKRPGIKRANLQNVIQQRAAAQITGHTLVSSTAIVDKLGCSQTDSSCGLDVTAVTKVTSSLNLQPIIKKLAGTSLTNGLELLQVEAPDATFTISRTPSWWPKHSFPYSDRYISIITRND